MPSIARILIYPVKALPGLEVDRTQFTSGGALRHDRTLAIVDANGTILSGKTEPRIHALDAQFRLEGDRPVVSLTNGGTVSRYRLDVQDHPRDVEAFADALSRYFERRVHLIRNEDIGFPDDTESPGPTLVSESSLNEVARWYPERTTEEMRARFRANLEITDCEPFWEDRLYGPPGVCHRFHIGAVVLAGINPCKRCVVPSRSPTTGEVLDGFQRTFVRRRRETLPPWADRSRFDIHYRLAINTRAADDALDGTVRVGDEVSLI